MKVLHLLDSTNRGGAEILALDLCRNASRNGLDVTLVATGKGDLLDEFKNSGVNFNFIERKMPVDLRLVYELKRIVDENEIRVIHGHQAVDGIHSYLTKLVTNAKTVMSFHGHIPSKKNDIALKYLIPRMDANIAVSHSLLKRLEEEIGFNTSKNFHIIYNGIDIRKFFKTNRDFRRELNLKDSDILMGMIGNFHTNVRDQLTICEALPTIFNKNTNIHFAFVGGRSETFPNFFDDCYTYCKYKNLLDRTHFLGSRSDVNDILNSLDIFVYSSNHDTFGIAVIEAMISGLPVVINAIPALLEVTDGGKYAKVFRSKSPNDLANKITELISNENERIRFANEGKKWTLTQFGIEKYISNLKNLYQSLWLIK